MGEVPLLKSLHESYKKRGVVFLGVSIDENFAALDKMVAQKSIPWLQICDGQGVEGEIAKSFRFGGNTPFFYLLDRDGRIAARFKSAEEVERHLNQVLATP